MIDPAAEGLAAWVVVGAGDDGVELGATLVAICETEPLSPALPIRTLTLTLIVPAAGVVSGADGAVRAGPSPTGADAVLSVAVSELLAVVSGSDPPVDARSASLSGSGSVGSGACPAASSPPVGVPASSSSVVAAMTASRASSASSTASAAWSTSEVSSSMVAAGSAADALAAASPSSAQAGAGRNATQLAMKAATQSAARGDA